MTSTRLICKPLTLVAGVSPEFDMGGGTLTGVLIEADITSTTFTIETARKASGVFTKLKDPTGRYAAAGDEVTFTVGGTATGFHSLPPELMAGIRHAKFAFGSSETPTVYAVYRSFE